MVLLMQMMEEKRQEMRNMMGRAAQACLLPTCILLEWTMTRCLSMAMAITSSDDMNTVTQGNVLTNLKQKCYFDFDWYFRLILIWYCFILTKANLHKERLLGITQDMQNPSITVSGIEVADSKSEMARLKMKMFRGVRKSFFLKYKVLLFMN